LKRILLIKAFVFFSCVHIYAQEDGYIHQGEFGITAGAAHYFGDLNTRTGLQRPGSAVGLFFRKQYGNYVGLRIAGRFAQLSYSDSYSSNEYQRKRNLSFHSNIFELGIQGDFNFFRFIPNDPIDHFTPYVTLGVGMFTYDPYDFYKGDKVYLRPLGTEGQAGGYLGRKEYGTMALCIPFGVGIKYSINAKYNLSFEVTHRFTTTDYLDDVSTTYAPNKFTATPGNPNLFPDGPNGPSLAYYMQDRSIEIDPNNPLSNTAGRQRGWSKQKDQYIIAEIGLSVNIGTYKCPTAN
jgi:hypothetical protein